MKSLIMLIIIVVFLLIGVSTVTAQNSPFYKMQQINGNEKWFFNRTEYSIFNNKENPRKEQLNPEDALFKSGESSFANFNNERWTLKFPYPTDTYLIDLEGTDNFVISTGIKLFSFYTLFSDLIWTTNKGIDWNIKHFANDTIVTALEMKQNSIWLVGSRMNADYGFVFKSTDFAYSWVEQLSIDSFLPLYLNFFDNNKGIVLTQKSENSQQLFKIFSTTDGGNNWAEKSSAINGSTEGLNANHFSSIDSGWICIRDFNNMYKILRTTDGGINWETQLTDTLDELSYIKFYDSKYGFAIGEKAIYPTSNNLILYSTTNGGINWQSNEIISDDFYSIFGYDLFFQNNFTFWLAVSDGYEAKIYKTTDGGVTLTELSQIEEIDLQLGKIKFISETRGWLVADGGSIYYTTDGGYTWTAKSRSITKDDLIDVDFVDSNNGWLASEDNSIFRTTDGGENWNVIYSDTASRNLINIDFTSLQSGNSIYKFYDYSTFTYSGIIGKTQNGGNDWQFTNYDSCGFNDLFFADQYSGWIVGEKDFNLIIYKSSDSENNWQQQTNMNLNNGPELETVHFYNDQIGFAVGNFGTILKTTNGGNYWQVAWGNFDPNQLWIHYNLTGVFLRSSNDCWVYGNKYSSGAYTNLIAHTTNQGLTWDTLTFSVQYGTGQIIFRGNTEGYCLGYKNYVTFDGGITWSLLAYPYSISKMFFTNQNNGWAVGYGGRIFKFYDSNTSIQENNKMLPVHFYLSQNYPNPFNPSTKISWQSPVGSHQTLKIYDVLGNEVATLVNEYKPAGSYEVEWDASKYSSGVYFYQLRTGNFVETKKMILMR